MIFNLSAFSLCAFMPGNTGPITYEAAFGDPESGGIAIEYGCPLLSCDMGTAGAGILPLRFELGTG